jgi:hypothetical protein
VSAQIRTLEGSGEGQWPEGKGKHYFFSFSSSLLVLGFGTAKSGDGAGFVSPEAAREASEMKPPARARLTISCNRELPGVRGALAAGDEDSPERATMPSGGGALKGILARPSGRETESVALNGGFGIAAALGEGALLNFGTNDEAERDNVWDSLE